MKRKSIMRYMFDKAVDLTHELHDGMTIYPGDPLPSFESYATIEKNGVNLTQLTLGSHTGTHLDAPRHFIPNGVGIDKIPPPKLVGEAYVADLSGKPIGSGITAEDLEENVEKQVRPDDILAVYTGCSEHWDDNSILQNYTYLTKEAAEYLLSKRVRAFGIDFLSVERFHSSDPVVHKTLLGSGIFIIESLSREIRQFVGKRILLVCMPIKIQNGDGAPARVIGVPIQID